MADTRLGSRCHEQSGNPIVKPPPKKTPPDPENMNNLYKIYHTRTVRSHVNKPDKWWKVERWKQTVDESQKKVKCEKDAREKKKGWEREKKKKRKREIWKKDR